MSDARKLAPVRGYLVDPVMFDQAHEVAQRNGVAPDRAEELLDLADALLRGELDFVHMPEIVAEAFGLDAEKALVLARDIVGYRLLPLDKYAPEFAAQIVAWGGKTEDYPDFRVKKEEFTVDQYAGKLTEQFALDLQPVHIKRLGFLVKSYVEGAKTRDATLMFFQRPAVIGGLGLAQDVSEKILAVVDEAKEGMEFTEAPADVKVETARGDVSNPIIEVKPEVIEPAPSMVPEVAPSHEVAKKEDAPVAIVAPKLQAIGGGPIPRKPDDAGDADEIKKHEKLLSKKGIGEASTDALENAVTSAVDAASATLAKKKISKKAFADVARMTVKGVRDPYQTRSMLERDFSVAGEDLVALLEAIMLGLERYHTRESRVKTARGDVSNKKIIGGVTAPRQSEGLADQKILDQRFASVVGEMPKEAIEPIMPAARVSAARTKVEETAVQATSLSLAKVEKAAAASKPLPAKAMLTVGSVPPLPSGEQKVVTDVQFRAKLIGPAEELGTMTPSDFRRLAANPTEAAGKVEDVLTNLEATSYEERIRGIQAWRQSPVNTLYMEMAGEALQEGIALAEVASRRRNKGLESLSPAEMKSVASINAKIQF